MTAKFSRVLAFSLLLSAFSLLIAPGAVRADPDYRGMADRIGVFLNEAVADYKSGNVESAKTKVQKAYFEVFENLEGPIRVNISAKKSYALEAEFGDIRKLIIDGIPAAEVEARVKAQIAEIEKTLPELENGFQLKAEVSDAVAESISAGAETTPAESVRVEPHWANVVDGIGSTLDQAASAYEGGDGERARTLIVAAQFDGYKNSLLETAVRRNVSQRMDIEINAEFVRIVGLVRDGKPARMVRASTKVLVDDLRRWIGGLPLLPGMEVAQTAADAAPEVNWHAVATQVLDEMKKAVSIHREGDTDRAVGHIQDTYFDVFEASGMEGKIGARDAAFKTQLEGHFNKAMGLMKNGASAADLEQALIDMSDDLDRAVSILGEGSESPVSLFVYALLIILREGFEAILIVTAILAYLVKTGNKDKQRIIYQSVAVALAASLVTAVLIKWVFKTSAASQEVLEGATMLLAAVVLFSMSYWLVSKAETQKWIAYIKDKVSDSLSSGSLRALWFASFLAVYREGAETVLFYEALTLDADAAGITAIAGGFAVGCVLLAVLYSAMRFGAMRIAIRPFFMITGTLLYYMAFVFAGKGMMELIEGKVIEPTLVSWLPEVPMVGMFPYWQTLAPQALLIMALVPAVFILTRRKPAVIGSD